MKRKNTVQAIVYRKKEENEILLLKRTKERGDFWQTISGRIEKGEKPVEAAKREVKEETGIDSYKKILELSNYYGSSDKNVKEYCFAFEVDNQINILLDNNPEIIEHDNFKWLSFEKAASLAKWPQYKSQIYLLKHYLENIK